MRPRSAVGDAPRGRIFAKFALAATPDAANPGAGGDGPGSQGVVGRSGATVTRWRRFRVGSAGWGGATWTYEPISVNTAPADFAIVLCARGCRYGDPLSDTDG